MDKVTRFLERYVEWLALVLGVAFLGWAIYSFVLQKPVSSQVGTRTDVSPGEVDRLVWDGPGQQLDTAIKSKTPAPMPDAAQDYTKLADDNRKKTPASVTPIFPGTYIPLTPQPEIIAKGPDKIINAGNTHVTQLPQAAAPFNLQIAHGHSNVPAPTPVVAAPENPAAPAPAQPAANLAVDKNWQTVSAMIPTAELAKSLADSKIPDVFKSTAILRVTLIRQERSGSGFWKDEHEIAPLEINELRVMPAIDAPANAQTDYFSWAEQNVALIAAPPFYKVLQGDLWYEPGTKSPNQQDLTLVDNGFDPKNPGAFKGDPNSLTPDELKELNDWKDKDAKSKTKKPPANNGNRAPQLPPGFVPPGGVPGGGGRNFAPDDPPRGGLPPGFVPPPMPGSNGFDPSHNNPEAPPNSPDQGSSGVNNTLPKGSFNPATQANIKIWAHDVTVEPGKTYRYMLQYTISNPVARTQGLCQPQSLADTFYIKSEKSAWTDPVSVESDTNFFAVDTKHGVHFDIFKWKDGQYQMQSVQVTAGDMVGTAGAVGTNTDFTTHWTLLDVREDPRDETNKTILLVSDNGTVLRKELNIDQRSSVYHHLLEQYNTNKAKNPTPSPAPDAPAT